MTFVGGIGSMYAITVHRPRLCVGNIAVPNFVRVLREFDPIGFLAADIEQTQFDFRGVCGKESEVDTETIPGRTQRKRLALAQIEAADIARGDVAHAANVAFR